MCEHYLVARRVLLVSVLRFRLRFTFAREHVKNMISRGASLLEGGLGEGSPVFSLLLQDLGCTMPSFSPVPSLQTGSQSQKKNVSLG